MNICAKCGFENRDNIKTCANCLTELHWAKVNLGKFRGNVDDTRKTGIQSRKERGFHVPEDEFSPLEPILEKENLVIKTNDTNRGWDFTMGFFGWALFHNVYFVISLASGALFHSNLVAIIFVSIPFLIGLLLLVRPKKVWIGVGSTTAIFIASMTWRLTGLSSFWAFLLPFPFGGLAFLY